MNAIDTNILVYLFDPSAPLKQGGHSYSEDMQHGADYDGVNIVNLFA